MTFEHKGKFIRLKKEQKQPQEGKPLTAEDFIQLNAWPVTGDEIHQAMEKYADYKAAQQTAALREELEAVKKERDSLRGTATKSWIALTFERIEHKKVRDQLSEVTRQRNEAVTIINDLHLMRDLFVCVGEVLEENEGECNAINKIFDRIGRLSSGDTNPESPWISVEDRLPRQGVKVLIAEWNSDMNGERIYNYTVGSYNGNKESIAEFTGIEEEAPGTYWPSHWMPLPAPPESLTDKK